MGHLTTSLSRASTATMKPSIPVSVLLVVVLAAYAGLVSGRCTPLSCMTIRCAQVTQDGCDGTVVRGGGYCGCCDACVKFLPDGSPCTPTQHTCANDNKLFWLLRPRPQCV